MRVSVVIPAHNGERFLAEAVASVLAQEQDGLELIVVDDGSTDGTAQVARSLGARCLEQENLGPAAARNAGIEAASGELIAFLDHDDLWPAGSLRALIARLEAEPELDLVMGRIRVEYLPGALPIEIPVDGPDDTLTHVNLGAGLFRRHVFDRVGLFDPAFPHAEDVDWFLRALEQRVPMRIIDAVTLVYRLHGANVTRDQARHQAFVARALRQSLERRRAGGESVAPLPRWLGVDERTIAAGERP
jgi:glycosyltransferase involved in cell wall biosynthesis